MSTGSARQRDGTARTHGGRGTPPVAAAEPPARVAPSRALALAIGGVMLLALGAAAVGRRAPIAAADGGSLPLIFLTGLLTGGLTCLAVQGGLLATAVARRAGGQGARADAPAGQVAPIARFLGAKLAAYTLLGGLLGLFGAAVGLTPVARGWLQIAAGLFMLGVAGQLLELHPLFRYFALQPPKRLQRWLRRESKRDSLFAPAVLGALTVFIPCGTTQAMMVAAVGTASPLRGALVMSAFVLGTTPLFFTLGYLATRLGAALQGAFARVAALGVAVLAAFSIWAGLALVGTPLADPTSLTGASTAGPPTAAAAAAAPDAASGVQEVVVRAEPRAYVPNRIQVKAGQPARLTVVTGERVGCTSVFTIPALGVERALPRNSEAAFDIPTDRAGRIRFTCGMGMYGGTIEVVR